VGTYLPEDNEITAHIKRRFYCAICKVWLRARPPLTEDMVAEAFAENERPHQVVSVIGKGPLVTGVLTVTVVEVADRERSAEAVRRFCPTCAPVMKDGLMELGVL
jgi:hypothetical protein